MTLHARTDERPAALRARLAEAEDLLQAIRKGAIDALVVEGAGGNQVYTLHSAEEPYRQLVEQMQEGAVVLTGRGDILYANARFAALVGTPLESVVGTHVGRFVGESDRHDFDAWLRTGAGRHRSRLIGADSVAFDVSLSLTTSAASSGDRLNLIVTDLRELLEANSTRDRALLESRTKDEFLATLAHELRNPLSAISSAVQLMQLVPAEEARAIHAREVIRRQVDHISRMISDLLDVERVASGKVRLNRRPVDMAEAVRRAVFSFTGDGRLDRDIDLSIEPVWVEGDPVRIEQVLSNLVTNAVKYTPRGGRIRVALRAEGDDAVLDVEDTGVGIAPRLLPFIFDMYMQADRTLARAEGGLGIGLSLVRRLVELHGGTIAAASGGEGHGSTFTVRLKRMPSATQSAGAASPAERRAKPRRVLLIEDSGAARAKLRMVLELAGHAVYDAADGVHGLELLTVVQPDVAIIDVSLPWMDGYQVARRIRETHGRDMLLLALTNDGDSRRPSDFGFDQHLLKPVDPEQLVRLLGESAEGPPGETGVSP